MEIMPLGEETRKYTHDYCVRVFFGDMSWRIDEFLFIDEPELRILLVGFTILLVMYTDSGAYGIH